MFSFSLSILMGIGEMKKENKRRKIKEADSEYEEFSSRVISISQCCLWIARRNAQNGWEDVLKYAN